jgi:hypothetical protein
LRKKVILITGAALREYAEANQFLLNCGGVGYGTWTSQEKFGIGILEIDAEALNLGTIRIFD